MTSIRNAQVSINVRLTTDSTEEKALIKKGGDPAGILEFHMYIYKCARTMHRRLNRRTASEVQSY